MQNTVALVRAHDLGTAVESQKTPWSVQTTNREKSYTHMNYEKPLNAHTVTSSVSLPPPARARATPLIYHGAKSGGQLSRIGQCALLIVF